MTLDRPETLALDTSAFLCRYLPDRRRAVVLDAMAEAKHWVATALVRTETVLALHQALGQGQFAPPPRVSPRSIVNHDWASMWEIPIDARCLHRAAELGAYYGIGINAALHLAALDRLPKPFRFVTFDNEQILAAVDLGFEVVFPDPVA